ncbi:hypothetical protein HDU98_012091 [Podochytrium sp. JEL0797]|nr:hypothetical protein HDU98_012091 [Podochytrium sp. JEL0797]
MTAVTKQDTLPAKEAATMRQIAKFHEAKQHKKGLKASDTILKKFPEHGEALAMKALFLSGLDRRDEAHETIKRAIKNDIGNHVCWHAYGLIHRAEKNYEEVVKCYSQALRIDKENLGIFRDFASMQCQLRNMDAFVEACLAIVLMRPHVKQFWLSLAAAFHLSNDLDGAIQAMKTYHDMFMHYAEKGVEYENSEIHLYRAMLLEEAGDRQGALDMLDSNENSILDKKSVKETRARLLLELGEMKQSELAYKTLFKINPDNYSALQGLQKSKGLYEDLDASKTSALFEMFEDLVDEHRRSNTLKRVPLNYASGDRFTRMMDHFLRFNFQKGVPSVFMSVRDLYTDAAKLSTIQTLLLSYVENLTAHSAFSAPIPAAADEDEIQVVEPPSAILWVYYYLAQHYDFLGDRSKALEYIELAIQHTPTLVELFMTKAKILKHAGDIQQAMQVMNYARNLDLQDRCINTKCVKYMLRAGEIEEAEKTVVLFCRVDSTDKLTDLVDMQSIWFQYEMAMAYIQKGDFGRALKKFNVIEKFFYDIYDDQFDFHTYSIRKCTMRTYINLFRMEDSLRGHPFYYKAAVEAVKLHIAAFDKKITDDKTREAEMSQMSDSDRKKALRKAKKAALMKGDSNPDVSKSTSSLTAAPAAAPSANKDGKKKDDDLDGSKLLTEGDLLTHSLQFLKPLLELSGGKVESQVLGCGVYLRRKNYLLAVKCLKKGLEIDAANPALHKLAVELSLAVQSDATIHEKVKPIVLEFLTPIIGASVQSLHAAFGATHAHKSLAHAVSHAETAAFVGADVSAAIEIVVSVSKAQIGAKSLNVEEAVAGHKALVGFKEAASGAQKEEFVRNYTTIAMQVSNASPPVQTSLGERVANRTHFTHLADLLHDSDTAAIRSTDARQPLTHRSFRHFILGLDPAALGITKSTRVGIVLPEGPELGVCLVSLMARCCVVPVNASLSGEEIVKEILEVGAEVAVVSVEQSSLIKLMADSGISVLIITPDSLTCGLFSLTATSSGIERNPSTLVRVVRKASRTFAGIDLSKLTGPTDIVMVLRTSGTSGKKKTVPYRLSTLVVGAKCVAETWGLEAGVDVNLNMMPLYHVGGIVRNLLAPLLSGSTVILTTGFSAEAFWNILQNYSPTWYYAVPTMHMEILEEGASIVFKRYGASGKNKSLPTSIRLIANAGGGLPHGLALQLREMFEGATVLPSYGMTECMPIASPPLGYALQKPGTSGVSVGPEVAIMNDRMQLLPPNSFGRIMVRGAPVFLGYEGNEEANKEAFTADGFFDTGDMGHLDADGYLFITGRSKEVINRGGEIISPVEIEDAVLKHPRVQNAIAFSVPHAVLQETIGVVIVTRGESRVGLSELQKFLTETLHPSKWPQLIVYMNDIPKNQTGKPLRIKLAERMSLPEQRDTIPLRDRLFEAQAPVNGTALTIPIQVSRVNSTSLTPSQNALDSMQDVNEAFVTVIDGSVVAFVAGSLNQEQILKRLSSQSLHDYQIPQVFTLPSLPRNNMGELDHRASMQLFKRREMEEVSEMELQVLRIFMTVLGLHNQPRKTDNFFEIGGNSLAAGKVTASIRSQFGIRLSPMVLFQHKTAASLAEALITISQLILGGVLATITTELTFPFLGILAKWAIIGRYKAGNFPLWGDYYLRWWIVDQILLMVGPGFFSLSSTTMSIYLRLMGAKIGWNVSFDSTTHFREFDLLHIDSNCIISSSIVRPFGVEPGLMILRPIVIEENCVVNTMSTISPGTILRSGTVLPPRSSSYESRDASEKYRIFASAVPTPNPIMILLFGLPVLLFVKLVAAIPWIASMYWLVQAPFFANPADPAFNNISLFGQFLMHQMQGYRIGIHILALVAKAVVGPFLELAACILVKRVLLGRFKAKQQTSNQFTAVKHWIMKVLLGDGELCGTYSLLGRHYQAISAVYRLLGATVGKRIYWPGTPMTIYEHDLLVVGDDVVFGSRSKLMFTDAIESRKIVIGAGAMVADRCVLLPGVTIGKNTMIGTGSLLPKNRHFSVGSTWIGSKNGEAVLWDAGNRMAAELEVTTKPFGKAFFMRGASYRTHGQWFIALYNIGVAAFARILWNMIPIYGVLSGGLYYTTILTPSQGNLKVETVAHLLFIGGAFLAYYFAAGFAISVSILSKWALLGQRKPGNFDWDKADYCQKWQVLITLQVIHNHLLDNIRGSHFIVMYFRALGCTIGERVCLYPTGGDPMMTEPDLITIGDHTVIDKASVVAHINSRGSFELNRMRIGCCCTLKPDSRLLSGAEMEDNSTLLEHTLIVGGEVVENGVTMQGWPSEVAAERTAGRRESEESLGTLVSPTSR